MRNILSLDRRICELLEERKWSGFTEAQLRAIPEILEGKNVLIVAPTGYGKTEAALLPVLHMMLNSPTKPVSLVYITPMKALINDLTLRISWWANKLGLSVSRKHGEVPQKERTGRLRNAPHIMVTTPEGLEVDLDWANKFREYYRNVKWMIIDEVHELIPTKRGAQLSVLAERLKELAGYDFQRIGLSATVGNPKTLSDYLFGTSIRRRVVVRVKTSKLIDVNVNKVQEELGWEGGAKAIAKGLKPPTLIFTNSRFSTERLFEEMERLKVQKVYVHHSSISRDMKNIAEDNLRKGEADAIICTKTLELGIDVGKIRKVILYRPPPSVASFLQRVGRSGHSIDGKIEGEVICLTDFDVLEAISLIELSKEGKIEGLEPIQEPLDVAAREVLGVVLQKGEVEVGQIYRIIRGSKYFRRLRPETFDELISYMEKNELLVVEGGKTSLGRGFFRIWQFDHKKRLPWVRSFSEFFSMISGNDVFLLRYEGKPVGEIDAPYVYRYIRNGDVIRISGRLWKVMRINNNVMLIDVIPVTKGEAEIPIWRGDSIIRSSLLVKEIPKILYNENEVVSRIRSWYIERGLPIPSNNVIFVEKGQGETVFSTLIDEKVSMTLAHMLMFEVSSKDTINTFARASIYGFSIKGEEDLLWKLASKSREEVKKIALAAVRRSPLFYSVMKEIQTSFGKMGKTSQKEDKLLIREALKQTVQRYFAIKRTVRYLERLNSGELTVVNLESQSPLGKAVLGSPPIRPWFSDPFRIIAETLEGGAYTVTELSEMVSLPPSTVEARLKKMRRGTGERRTISFIDVDDAEIRWCLAKDLRKIYGSDSFYSSFHPNEVDQSAIAMIRTGQDDGFLEMLFTPKEIIEDPDLYRRKIPFEEVAELRVKDPAEPILQSPRYYFISRDLLPIILLNATSYIQSLKYS
ncbi:ATP-dependent helicase [Sulfodiicoccus acidiphilus]|uniref:ATP-dependent helicase n=1 Tax=Sulfodiicoccus acidiphilus TaxID=1670455 RepID=A0A348B397_9CREN|nr:DEAD/DEAH box helicase [Sulfodiicoccus acidiphilus]BBD72649.1 ATP-dependent helicase [Sulfodiicoccus acidiphilus]GGT95712.1 ATP-dependent helicase [Sulfodiicoccus acidiphilus]